MPIIRVGVQAPQGSAGQVVDLDANPNATISSIANVSAEAVAYSLDGGGTWTTIAAGASAGGATVGAGMFRMRKVASTGAYPAIVDVDAAPSSSVSGGGNAEAIAASTTIPLDGRKYMPAQNAASGLAFTVQTVGMSTAGQCVVPVIGNGNGAHIPTVSGATEIIGSRPFDTTNGTTNLLIVEVIGGYACYQWVAGVTNFALPDVTAPTVSSMSVNGSALSIVWSETLQAAPAAASFSVIGAGGVTQTPSASSQSGTTTTLTLTTPAISANTVTINISAGAALDPAGNASAAVTGAAVTNSTPAAAVGTSMPLTSRSAGLSFSGSNYTGGAGVTGWEAYGTPGTQSIASAGAGWIAVNLSSGSNGAVVLGFATSPSPIQSTTLIAQAQISTASSVVRQGAGQVAGTSTVDVTALATPGPNTYYRLRRAAGNVYTIDVTTNAGGLWTTIHTFSGVTSSVALYPVMFTLENNTFYNPRQSGVA